MKAGLLPDFEQKLLKEKNYKRIVGVDEVGRGCLAGPLVVGAFVYDTESKTFQGVNDSKKLSKSNREKIALKVNKANYEIVKHEAYEIDKFGLASSLNTLFTQIYDRFNDEETFFLIDGNHKSSFGENVLKITKGDSTYYSIAMASIVAKVYRDNLMCTVSKLYPNYHFENNVGYGTAKHLEIIRKNGLTPLHRKSFKIRL